MSGTPTIVGLGELLWDDFPDARRPGGAPANVAFHATRLGNRGVVASRVGDDDPGRALTEFLASSGLDVDFIQEDKQRPTGRVTVRFDDGEPEYRIHEGVAWDAIAPTPALLDLARKADAVCFGTLAQRAPESRAAIRAVLDAAGGLRVFDVNLRPPFDSAEVLADSLRQADVVKIFRSERDTISSLFGAPDPVEWLRSQGVEIVCLTLGAAGARLYHSDGAIDVEGRPVDTREGDPVGVGDAFLATLTHQLVRQAPLDLAVRAANWYAGQVAARRGAMPRVPDHDLPPDLC